MYPQLQPFDISGTPACPEWGARCSGKVCHPPNSSVMKESFLHFADEKTKALRDEVTCLGWGWERDLHPDPSHFKEPAAFPTPSLHPRPTARHTHPVWPLLGEEVPSDPVLASFPETEGGWFTVLRYLPVVLTLAVLVYLGLMTRLPWR